MIEFMIYLYAEVTVINIKSGISYEQVKDRVDFYTKKTLDDKVYSVHYMLSQTVKDIMSGEFQQNVLGLFLNR